MSKKHVTLFGPGSNPTLVVSHDKAEEIKKAVKNKVYLELVVNDSEVCIRGDVCWAMISKDVGE